MVVRRLPNQNTCLINAKRVFVIQELPNDSSMIDWLFYLISLLSTAK